MKRLWPVWPIFVLCALLAAGAMVRVGNTALSLERAEAKARRQAALEESLQLALWRMDSALAPLMAEESARPYFTYSPLYPAERAFTNMFAEIEKGDQRLFQLTVGHRRGAIFACLLAGIATDPLLEPLWPGHCLKLGSNELSQRLFEDSDRTESINTGVV